MGRAIILVMDSFGVGATADADKFGDVGSNTLGSIARIRAVLYHRRLLVGRYTDCT